MHQIAIEVLLWTLIVFVIHRIVRFTPSLLVNWKTYLKTIVRVRDSVRNSEKRVFPEQSAPVEDTVVDPGEMAKKGDI